MYKQTQAQTERQIQKMNINSFVQFILVNQGWLNITEYINRMS